MSRSRRCSLGLPVMLAVFGLWLEAAPAYFPPAGKWQKKAPAELGMDAAKLQQAIDYAQSHGSTWDFDKDQVRTFGAVLGVVAEAARGDQRHHPASRLHCRGVR